MDFYALNVVPINGWATAYGGAEADLRTPRDAIRQGIKVVFQEIALISEFTVADNIFFEEYPVDRIGSIRWGSIRKDAAALFERVGFNVDPGAKVPWQTTLPPQPSTAAHTECKVVKIDRYKSKS